MQHFGLNSLCLFLIATLMWSCSKEELTPDSKNTLTLDGKPFSITMVSILGISMDDAGHAAINFTGMDGTTTRSLAIDVEYAPTQTIGGTYSYPQSGGNRHLDDWLTNYTEFSGSNELTSVNLERGTVTLTDNGKSNFTITMDLEMTDGKIFKGTYQGPVQEVYHNE